MPEINVIFSDIDGTFLTSGHRVSPRTAGEVRRAVGLGIPFILISSRMPEAILPIQKMAGIRQPLIAYGGGLILDGDGDVLFSRGMEPDTAAAVGRLVEAEFPGVAWNFYNAHRWLCPSGDGPHGWVAREESIVGFRAVPGTLEDVPGWETVHKILCMGSPQSISALQRRLGAEFPDLNASLSSPCYLEVSPTSVDKGTALETFCRLYGIPVGQSLAFGDNYNDLEMLRRAGTAYAMANAPEEIRAAAGNVTADNDHDGIAQVLERLL